MKDRGFLLSHFNREPLLFFSIDHADSRVGWILDALFVLLAVIMVVYEGRESLSGSTESIRE
jgi:hypothetical protein